MGDSDPRTLGEEAIARLLRSNTPDRPSLAAAYAVGYMALWRAQEEGTTPYWYEEIDPLDTLFLGTFFPKTCSDEFEFANVRDAWLRLLRGTVHGKGILRFVREAVSASADLKLPVDDRELMLALIGRLEAAGLDGRRLPRRLMPEVALQDCRAACGPPLDLRLPEPPEDAKRQVKRFWKTTDDSSWANDTPLRILRDGLRRFHDAGLLVKDESVLLLPALYTALMAKPGEQLEDSLEHATAWALALDETSTLVKVVDILLVAPELGMSVADVLGHLFAVPAFTDPLPSDALLWTSSPGLGLPRLAFELGISEVPTMDGVITPDLLDWVGMHTRMRLSATARGNTDDPEEADVADGTSNTNEESDEQWAERREAVRKAVSQKIRKKSGGPTARSWQMDRPVERLWNADGSSVVQFSTANPFGQELKEAIDSQLDAFREKFGREPRSEDPLFFDPDADEPAPLSKEYFDGMLLDMAEHADEIGIDPAFLHAWREVGYVVTEENMSLHTTAEVLAFKRAVARHRQDGK
ncbi:hypothetical protein ACFU99_11620 [Streptomyces sp. NPDC057654]|uniref:hypothetical protein n=1 Tax=Streptomyces sp. NPDC057654 TaxID=3346196 RepID=UPI0036A8A632